MSITRCLAALSLPAVSTVMAFAAPNPVGSWKGRLHLDLSSLPAQQRQQAAAYTGMLAKMKVSLSIKKDHTFTTMVEGIPNMKEPQKDSGTWSIKGYTVTLNTPKRPGPGQAFTLSKDGKTMRTNFPGTGAGKSEFVFSR